MCNHICENFLSAVIACVGTGFQGPSILISECLYGLTNYGKMDYMKKNREKCDGAGIVLSIPFVFITLPVSILIAPFVGIGYMICYGTTQSPITIRMVQSTNPIPTQY
jgi:hypothetical protein